MIERLLPMAEELECTEHLRRVQAIADRPSWAEQQRQIHRETGDMAEVALAHKVGNAVEQAYRRGDMLGKRRKMMADWAAFLGA